MGQPITFVNASTAKEIQVAFGVLAKDGITALLVAGDPIFVGLRNEIVALAAKHSIPTMYPDREFPVVGGLISYSTSLTDAYRLVGVYTGKVANGAKPADLPVLQSTKFELVINVKTAKALNLTIAPGVLAIADEVIE